MAKFHCYTIYTALCPVSFGDAAFAVKINSSGSWCYVNEGAGSIGLALSINTLEGVRRV